MEFAHHIDIYFALAAAVINGLFILLILTRTSLAEVYVAFLLNCLTAIIWTFGDFMAWKTADLHGPWFLFSLIGTGMVPAVLVHFISALAGRANNKKWITISYILCLPFALSSLLALWHTGIRTFVVSPDWNKLFLPLFFISIIASVIILKTAIRGAKSKSDKSRFYYVLAAVLIALFTCTPDMLQVFHVQVPPLGHVGTVIYSLVLAVGVFKHRIAYDLLVEMRTKLDMLNELAAGIAHELRNPLSSIKGAANLLHEKSGNLTAEKSRAYLSLISDEVERLDGMLTNYRGLIRPAKVEKEDVSVNFVIEKTVALMRMNENAPKIELKLLPELPICKSDPNTLRQVFINLIKNAHEACGSKGTLYITTEYIPPLIRIIFKDSGKGVPPEILPRLFEPFMSTKANGMGLGLAICRRLIDLNGGTIEAINDNEGMRFTIHLPARDASLSQA
jgi:signal transduction histidine kinase